MKTKITGTRVGKQRPQTGVDRPPPKNRIFWSLGISLSKPRVQVRLDQECSTGRGGRGGRKDGEGDEESEQPTVHPEMHNLSSASSGGWSVSS